MASYDDTATVSGSVVSFSDGADEVGLKSCVVSLPVSLSGYSSIDATKVPSKNILTLPEADFTINGIRFYTANGILYLDGTQTAAISSLNESFKALDFWIPSGTYYFNRGTIALPTYIRTYDDMAEFQVNNGTFTITEPKHLYVSIYMANKTFSNAKADMCVSVGSTAITYEDSKQKESYVASLGRTIYGGTADVATGSGIDNTKKIKLNTLSWQYNDTEYSYGYFDAKYNQTDMSGNMNFQVTEYINNQNPRSALANGEVGVYNKGNAIKRLVIRDDSCTSLEQFLEKIANYDFVYECTNTPTSFTFTPVSIETSKGSNTLWSDQGNTELTYYKDGYGFTSVTIHKETPDGEPVEQTVKLHRIVYQGQVDVVTGKGTTNYKNFKLSDLSWSGGVIGGQMWCWYVDLSTEGLKLPANSEIFDGLCDSYTPIRYNAIATNANTIALRNNGYLYVNNGSDTVKPTGNVLITLATPTEFTFPPISIETDEGENTLYADQGDSAITYRKAVD